MAKNPKAAIRDALTEAFAEAEEPTDEVTAEAENPPVEDETPSSEETTEAPENTEEAPEAPEGTGDAPTEYYGVKLDGLPPEERLAVVKAFQEQDKFIQQLLRDKAKGEPAAAQDETPSEDVVTDADILKALGLDAEDDMFAEQTAKVAVPLAKAVMSLQEQVEALSNKSAVAETERYWETSLTALESQYGRLPVDHDEVYKLAAENGIAEPMDAFWRIMGPARQAVHAEVAKRQAALEAAQKKGAAGITRPAAQADTQDKPIDAKDSKSATKAALAQYFREKGIDVS